MTRHGPHRPSDPDRNDRLELARLKRRRGRPVSQNLRPLGPVALAFSNKNAPPIDPSKTKLETQWSRIVGEKLAQLTRPGKAVTTPRGRELIVYVLPAAAVIVEHQSEMIRQKVSLAAGGDIVGIRLKQGLPDAPEPKDERPKVTFRDLTEPERQQIEADCAEFSDPRLKAAIVSLATSMLTRQEKG